MINLYKIFLKHSLQEFLINRGTALITFVLGLSFFAIEIIAGFVFFEQIDSIWGWSRTDYMLVVSNASIISFLYQTLFIIAHENLTDFILEGELDHILIRPINSLMYVSLSRIDISSLLNLLVAVGLQYYFVLSYKPTFFQVVLLIVSICLSTYLVFILNQLAVSVTFWVEKAGSIIGLPENLLDFSSRPLVVYPNSIRFLLTWIVPLVIGVNLPVLILKSEKVYHYFIILMTVLCLGTWLINIFWKKGLLKYASAN
ncbi:TPA: ABC-2 family transporter protein [Streptococcus suis]